MERAVVCYVADGVSVLDPANLTANDVVVNHGKHCLFINVAKMPSLSESLIILQLLRCARRATTSLLYLTVSYVRLCKPYCLTLLQNIIVLCSHGKAIRADLRSAAI